jgi:hypothetical protein
MQQGSLLWVYEGMTQYLGNVLAARSGLKSQEQYRDMLALSAANLDYKPGREWRSTEDTAIAASILRGGNPAWSNWKRGQDYYQEGELLWLDADTLIRKLTNNKKSLTTSSRSSSARAATPARSSSPTTAKSSSSRSQRSRCPTTGRSSCMTASINQSARRPRRHRAGRLQARLSDKPTKSERTLASNGGRRGGLNVWYSLGLRVE